MKWILFFIAFIFLTPFQEKENISITPDKKIYNQGEIITLKVKSKKRFRLATDGDCSSSVLPPTYIREINGKFPPAFQGPQMCCGLPCSINSMKKIEYTMSDTLEIGRWKMLLTTCEFGLVESEIFEII
ncbi:MAG: hypothetical protein ACPG5P_09085 [Saprospiraceae bacterium]